MNYKKVLIEILLNARECTETQGEKGYYLVSKVNDPRAIKTIRKMVARLNRKGAYKW